MLTEISNLTPGKDNRQVSQVSVNENTNSESPAAEKDDLFDDCERFDLNVSFCWLLKILNIYF